MSTPRKLPKRFTVTYQSASQARSAPDWDTLENGWLHRAFLITHHLATWPVWKLGLMLLGMAVLAWYSWLPLGPIAFTAAAVHMGFTLADWILLSWLPQSGRSYGPVGPQLLVMTTPRLLLTILLGLAGLAWSNPALMLWLLALLQLGGFLADLWGTVYEPFALGRSNMTIYAPHWSITTDPLRLLHLSDLHLERLTEREGHLLNLVKQIQPDLIVITGDYLNLSYVDDPLARTQLRQMLAELYAPYGIYAILGSPPVDPPSTTPSLFTGLNIRLLRDEVATLRLADGRTLALLGLDCSHNLSIDGQVFKELITLAPPNSTRVLLYHSPELMPLVRQYPVELYLCGHTHGGQVRLPLYGAIITSSQLGKRYVMGPYTEEGTTLYISRGLGLEGMSAPRMRLLCPPEITLFTLVGGKSKTPPEEQPKDL